jgi:hypothetical protein
MGRRGRATEVTTLLISRVSFDDPTSLISILFLEGLWGVIFPSAIGDHLEKCGLLTDIWGLWTGSPPSWPFWSLVNMYIFIH